MIEPSEYSLRTYVQGDEKAIIPLFNRAYESFAGIVPRTLEYWKWCVLSRPDLDEKGIFLIAFADRIVGYAAVTKTGTILEFCYDPDYDGRKIASMLLRKSVDYVKHHGGDSISLNAPIQDSIIRQVCREMEFTAEPFPTLFLKVQDLPKLLERIYAREKKVNLEAEETVLFRLKDVPSWCPKQVTLRIRKEEASVFSQIMGKPTIIVETDLSTISASILGSGRRLYIAAIKGQLKVHPLRKIRKALKILSSLRLRNPWYVPGADYG